MDLDHLSQLYSLRGVRHDTHWWWCNVLLIGKTGIFSFSALWKTLRLTTMQTITEIFLLCFKEVKEKEEERKRKRKEKIKNNQKGKRKGPVTRYWYVKNKNSCKKDQCNKSHSLIPLHSNWTCVLKATAAGFISHPNRIKLWNSSWHKASEICVQTRTGLPLLVWADVKMFQYLLRVVRFYFFFWATLTSPANLSKSV